MLLSVVYVALKGILQLVSLLFRSADSKEIEIIVLRPQSIAASGLTASRRPLVIGHAFLIDAEFQNGSPYFLGQLFSASLRNSQFVYRIFTDQHDVSISHDDCVQSHKHMTEPSFHELNLRSHYTFDAGSAET